jgi:hypothetical protein
MQLLFIDRCVEFIRSRGATFYNAPHCSWENRNMTDKETKAKAPSKKELMREIENLDTKKVFDLVSLGRTNVANIKAIAVMLKG